MAHFARIDENNVVVDVIVVSNSDAPDPAPHNSEPIGQQFIASIGLDGLWLQTSYSRKFRGKYASVGMVYIPDLDVFVWPKPAESWVLDGNYDWQAPVPMPSESGPWVWDEDTLSWVEITD